MAKNTKLETQWSRVRVAMNALPLRALESNQGQYPGTTQALAELSKDLQRLRASIAMTRRTMPPKLRTFYKNRAKQSKR
jgi:hypothetical protein